jgi:hypothetical protein
MNFLLTHMSPQIFEAIMLICFGAAWPASIYKSFRARRNEGESAYFLYIILFGYLNGIAFQYLNVSSEINYVFYLFLLNAFMVLIDIIIYHRNAKINNFPIGDN